VDAVKLAVEVLEDEATANAGYGSNLTFDGTVEVISPARLQGSVHEQVLLAACGVLLRALCARPRLAAIIFRTRGSGG